MVKRSIWNLAAPDPKKKQVEIKPNESELTIDFAK